MLQYLKTVNGTEYLGPVPAAAISCKFPSFIDMLSTWNYLRQRQVPALLIVLKSDFSTCYRSKYCTNKYLHYLLNDKGKYF